MIKWLAIFILVWFIWLIREVFPPFIVGGIIAYLLLPFVSWVSSIFKIHAKVAVAIIYVGAFAGIIYLSNAFGGNIMDQASNLVTQRHEIMTNLLEQVSTSYNWQIDVEETATELVSDLESWFGKPGEIVHLGEILSKSLLSVLVCIVSSIYFIVDSERVGKFFLRFVPVESRETVVQLSGQMHIMLSKYIRGQIFLIILMSCVAYFFLHFVFHVKYALLLAIVSGVLEIIPVLGPLLAISMAVIVGVAQHGTQVALPIFLCYWLARLIEDYLVIPRFIGHVVELHPLAIIMAVLCGEVTAGALGMLIAIPVAAALKEILDFIYPPTDAPPREPTGAYKAMPDLKPDLKEVPPIISSDSPVSLEKDNSEKIDTEAGAVEKILRDG
ncbi:MAG: AI-2E family transporter [Cyanobacteriota/Melainabacteria group bacterium]|nr:AI-2E family transporter [Candidatus Obscuribacterales bacterium]